MTRARVQVLDIAVVQCIDGNTSVSLPVMYEELKLTVLAEFILWVYTVL